MVRLIAVSSFPVFVATVAHAQLRPLSGPLPPAMPSWSFDENDHAPDWSPDGRQIVVTRRSPTRSYQLYLMNADGSEPTQLTTGPGNNQYGTFAPTGDRIAFVSYRDGVGAIYVMDLTTGAVRRLTHDSASVGERPAWSPDGRRIAYASDRGGHDDIWIMTADGGDHVAVTNDPASDQHPAWSPDGRTIAFDRIVDGQRDIWTVRADGTDRRRITQRAGYDGYPDWSPDGRQIVFFGYDRDRWSVYLMRADGSDRRQLTDAPGWNFDPVWSPDGRRILFDSRRDGRRGLYVVNTDGSGERKITNTESSEFAAIVRTAGAAEAVRRYYAAAVAMPRATFFLPTEIEVVAQELIAAGKMNDAALVLDAALHHQPQYSGIADELTDVARAVGRPVPPPSDSLQSLFRRGGFYEGAAALAELSLRFPSWPLLSSGQFNAIADEYEEDGNVDDAIRVIRLSLARYPDRAEDVRRLALLTYPRGTAEAAAYLDRALELLPDDIDLRRLAAERR